MSVKSLHTALLLNMASRRSTTNLPEPTVPPMAGLAARSYRFGVVAGKRQQLGASLFLAPYISSFHGRIRSVYYRVRKRESWEKAKTPVPAYFLKRGPRIPKYLALLGGAVQFRALYLKHGIPYQASNCRLWVFAKPNIADSQ